MFSKKIFLPQVKPQQPNETYFAQWTKNLDSITNGTSRNQIWSKLTVFELCPARFEFRTTMHRSSQEGTELSKRQIHFHSNGPSRVHPFEIA